MCLSNVRSATSRFSRRFSSRSTRSSVRDNVPGVSIGTKNQFRVCAGDFILSKIDARQGAFGIVPPEADDGIITGNFWTYRVDNKIVDTDWFLQFTNTNDFLELCKRSSTGNTHRKYLDEEIFLNHELEIPSLEDQRKAVVSCTSGKERVEEIQHEITHQETLLAKLQQAILQEAIQGKLTADWRAAHPQAEPASQILHRIQAEKARLIAAKQLRPEKLLPDITPEEIPFAIPKTWEWCRLGSIARHSLGKMLDHGKNKGTPRPYLRNLNVQWFRFVLSDLKEMRFEDHEAEKYSVQKGDIVICEGGYRISTATTSPA